MSDFLRRLFAPPRRVPLPAAPPARPVIALSHAQAASRNQARMHRAAMARERRSIDGR